MMFSAKQVDQLLKPIAPKRVLRDGKGHSHVSQQDILAHLVRVFGFGNFDIDVVDTTVVFEQPAFKNGKPVPGRYNVCYRAMVRLTVRDEAGNECHFENGSTATAQNQTLGDAHDLAYKSAISLSIKRCAIALGDQFGLSLYNKGQQTALVIDTIVHPERETEKDDLQEGVEQQVSLGNDESTPEQDAELTADSPTSLNPHNVSEIDDRISAASSLDELRDLWKVGVAAGLKSELLDRKKELEASS